MDSGEEQQVWFCQVLSAGVGLTIAAYNPGLVGFFLGERGFPPELQNGPNIEGTLDLSVSHKEQKVR